VRKLQLNLETPIKSKVPFKLIEILPYTEILHLNGYLSYFNLDSLSNLKELDLRYKIMETLIFTYLIIYAINWKILLYSVQTWMINI
jgi:hypothetical protein